MKSWLKPLAFPHGHGQRSIRKLAIAVSLLGISPLTLAADDDGTTIPYPKVCDLFNACIESASISEWVDHFYPKPKRNWWKVTKGPYECLAPNGMRAKCYDLQIDGQSYLEGTIVRAIIGCPDGTFFGKVSQRCRKICPEGEYLVKDVSPDQCKPNPKPEERDPDDTADPEQGMPECPKRSEEMDKTTGNPINTATGNKFQREIDTLLGVPFIRFYNSHDSGPKHQLGLGWRHNWHARVLPVYSYFIDPGIPPHMDPDWREYWNSRAANSSGPKPRLLFYRLERTDGASFSATTDGRIIGATDKNTLKLTIGPTGFTVFDGVNTEHYDAKGNLVSLIEGGGKRYTLTYADKLLSQVKDDTTGRTLTFTYRRETLGGIEDDWLSKVESGNASGTTGLVASFDYSPKGYLAKVTHADGTTRQYVHDDPERGDKLSGLIDENGVRFATWSYNRYGAAISSEHAGGVNRYTLSFGGARGWPSTAQTSPTGATRFFNYQQIGRRLLFAGNWQPGGSGCNASTRKRTYDSAGNPQEQIDFNGNVTWFTYDPERDLEVTRIEAATSSAPRAVTTQWHATFRLPTKISANDRTVSFDYDERANLTKKTVESNGKVWSWRYAYDSNNRLMSVTDPAGRSSEFGYDATGNLVSFKDRAGLVTTYGPHNAHGQPLSITRPDGVVASMTYDARGRLLTYSEGQSVTRYQYAPTGLLKQVNLPDGSQIDYEYDPAHRLVGIRNNQGHSIRYVLDAAGNRLQQDVQDANGTLAAAMAKVDAERLSLIAPNSLPTQQDSE
ncbi:RHS repeat domain-containing protein [Chitinimonas lacunae]|uniref:RHS repeat domain-containing protein n=1 Tax=Chitinimonas lacunae TaxID=1963018 RepID=A0ABV8MQC1_9NEIS